MKILLVTVKNSQFTEQMLTAFRDLGHEVLLLNDRSFFIFSGINTENKFIWKITRKIKFLRRWGKYNFEKTLLSTCNKFKPDTLFVVKGMIIKGETIRQVSKMGIKTVNWFLDSAVGSIYKQWIKNNHFYYDHFFSFESIAGEFKKQGHNIGFLPVAAELMDAKKDPKFGCDVCFVGAPYPERVKILQSISDFGLKIYGWKGWEKTVLANQYYGPLTGKEFANLYKTAKICININLEPPCPGVNLKTFEIPAVGGFQLSDFREGIAELFEPGKEIEIFRNVSELREKVKYYLDNEQKRLKIAEAGRKRQAECHTMKTRLADALKVINSN